MEGLRRTTKNIRIVGVQDRIRTEHLPNSSRALLLHQLLGLPFEILQRTLCICGAERGSFSEVGLDGVSGCTGHSRRVHGPGATRPLGNADRRCGFLAVMSPPAATAQLERFRSLASSGGALFSYSGTSVVADVRTDYLQVRRNVTATRPCPVAFLDRYA
jgi:hypothetical protein